MQKDLNLIQSKNTKLCELVEDLGQKLEALCIFMAKTMKMMEALDRQKNELLADKAQLNKRIEDLETQLQAVYNSFSWRMTALLRYFKHKVAGFFAKILNILIRTSLVQRAYDRLCTYPLLKHAVMRILKGIGLYGFLRNLYLTQKVDFTNDSLVKIVMSFSIQYKQVKQQLFKKINQKLNL